MAYLILKWDRVKSEGKLLDLARERNYFLSEEDKKPGGFPCLEMLYRSPLEALGYELEPVHNAWAQRGKRRMAEDFYWTDDKILTDPKAKEELSKLEKHGLEVVIFS